MTSFLSIINPVFRQKIASINCTASSRVEPAFGLGNLVLAGSLAKGLLGRFFRLPFILVLFFLFALPGYSSAHPHIFIRAELELDFNAQGLRGFWQHWSFDEFFSSTLISDFDSDRDGKFSPAEIKELYEEAFLNLRQHGFFTRVIVGDKAVPVKDVQDFSAQIVDKAVVYSFFVPLALTEEELKDDLLIAVFDDSFFCQVIFPPRQVGFLGDKKSWNVNHVTQDLPEYTYFFGFVVPVALRFSITPAL